MNISKELIEKAKTAKTAEELLEMAKEESIEMSAEQAAEYFATIHASSELPDEELDNVLGGGCDGADTTGKRKFDVGDHVLVNKYYPATVVSYRTGRYDGKTYYIYDVIYETPYRGSEGGTFEEEQLARA